VCNSACNIRTSIAVDGHQVNPALCFNATIPSGSGRSIIGLARSGTSLLQVLAVHALYVQNGRVWTQQTPDDSGRVSIHTNTHHVLSQASLFLPKAPISISSSKFHQSLQALRVSELWGGHISQVEAVDYHTRYLVQRHHTDPQLDYFRDGSAAKKRLEYCTQQLQLKRDFDELQLLGSQGATDGCKPSAGPAQQILSYFNGKLYPTNAFYASEQGRCPTTDDNQTSTYFDVSSSGSSTQTMSHRLVSCDQCRNWRVLLVNRHPIDVFLSQLRFGRPGSVAEAPKQFSFSQSQHQTCGSVRSSGGRRTQCQQYSTLSQFFNILEW